MSRYANGKIPANRLVHVGNRDYLTAATARRWNNLVADVKRNEGVTLRITQGQFPNAYRDLAGQKKARTYWCALGACNNAAYPGTSSHGGEYRGKDSMAVDVNNWMELGKTKFYRYARKHGFTPGVFDWEPWHLVDWNPWVMPDSSGSGGGESKPVPEPVPPVVVPEEEEDEEMSMKLFGYKNPEDGRTWYVQFDSSSGFWSEFVSDDQAYIQSLAAKWTTDGIPALSVGHRNDLKKESDDVKARRSS